MPGKKYTEDSRPRKWPIMVCGRQPNRDGSMHCEHKDLVQKAVLTYLILTKDPAFETGKVVIILTGGVCKNGMSEAALAHSYLEAYAREQGVTLPEVLLEDRSRSTEENVTCSKTLLEKMCFLVTRVYLVARVSQGPKLIDMAVDAWKLPLEKITIVPGLDVTIWAPLRYFDATWLPRLLRYPRFKRLWNGTRSVHLH